MADPVVEAIFKTRLALLLPIPFVETVNVRPDGIPLPDKLFTLKRDFANVQRITLGPSPNSQYREEGTLVVAVAVRSGTGDVEAKDIAEQVRNLFFNYDYDHFRVTAVDTPVIGSLEEGNYFQLDVPVRYQFDFFK